MVNTCICGKHVYLCKTRVFVENTCILKNARFEKHVYLWKTRVFMENACVFEKYVF